MNNTSMTIRTDKEIKQQAQKIFSELGVDMSTAVNVFLRQAIKYQGFPFDVTLETPNELTRKAMADAENGIGLHGPFNSVAELMEDLNA
ncbi:MAG: type II toxin-antitoxin system RelB/DinJ family antitoxin [Clostridia bacterium]|nr:type II toxin-antitoxin system RelB/DinJ family antitoxin [Clostridia bacterium]